MERIWVIIVVVGTGRAPYLYPRTLYYPLIAAPIRRPSSILFFISSCNETWPQFWLVSLHPSDDFESDPCSSLSSVFVQRET
ncbi:hypothetical protein B0H19DRAFT_1097143 [Mycena capillaripes]|nr:hypothetical protein B0H19DRAFT_1203557 [Mycena capillaripes]KAJ6594929.1 hypothetical protein B0H19DRAFT_1097143 [Mycena capillaripes]